MARYILIDHNSGYVWGEADAADPIEACRIVDNDIGCEPREYEEAWLQNSREHGYHVYEAPAGWVPVNDGQSQSEIDRVIALRRVAQVAFRYADNSCN